jgi:hypothetical protein
MQRAVPHPAAGLQGARLLPAARWPARPFAAHRSPARLLPPLLPLLVLLALPVGALFALPARAAAHEIPSSVLVQAFVKLEGQRLRMLVRVPLEAMRDIEFPLRGPGYLELDGLEPYLTVGARMWIADFLELYEDDSPIGPPRIVAARVSVPSDLSFMEYDAALAHVTGEPLPPATELIWQQALLDVLLEYTIASDEARFSIRPGLAHLGMRTTTVLRFLSPGSPERAFQYVGDPGLVRLDPRWHQAALSFVRLGFHHILEGIDHILFVLCLVIPFRRFLPLVAVITSFTVAHSITLIASALGFGAGALWFPPLIEMLIALSIVFMAFENIVGVKLKRRWLIAFGFGLVHGFGFSFLLRESLQFAGSHLTTSLLAFNVGVELGQIAVLAVAIPALALLFRYVVAERMGVIILSALIAHTAWHWMADRWAELAEYEIVWPALDLALLAAAMRWTMLALILAGVAWLLYELFGRFVRAPAGQPGDGISPQSAQRAQSTD